MADQPLELYPLRTEPVFRHYIWGGDKLGPLLGKPMGPDGTLAESWEIADEARVANGPLAGRTLREVDEASGGALVGDGPRYPNAQVPLLIKLSHAAQDLSVQIHPNDEQARRDEPERGYPGKAEMYFIMEADPGAGVYWGLRDGVTPQQLKDAARAASGVADLINFVPVTAGDVLYSPAGVVHAIGKGIVYCEVQEDSDITYRLYDWGRVDAQGKPRPLHLEQAMRVLAPSSRSTPEVRPLALRATQGVARTLLCVCPHFAVELLELDSPANLLRARAAIRAAIVLEGLVTFEGPGSELTVCRTGQSCAIPASLPHIRAVPDGHARLLFAYLPDMRGDIIEPLRAAGYSDADIAQLGDVR